MKASTNHKSRQYYKSAPCDCINYVFRRGQLVCKRCGKAMKNEKKPLTAKGARHKSGYYNR